uniref:Uncharacterized protein n=1 Tax=Glossina austeni TaxID=7395 RepID=A0A1A9VY41_GLOAU
MFGKENTHPDAYEFSLTQNKSLTALNKENSKLSKVRYVTSLRMPYEFPMWSDSNRTLREFMLCFREEDCSNTMFIGSQYIKDWMGNFSSVQVWSKLYVQRFEH